MVEKEKGVNIKCLRSDGGGEYFSKEFNEYLKEHGIQRKYSCSYSPQQNGVAERKNRHIAEITCAMLNEKNLLNYFWAETIATAVYIMNRTPTATIHGMTPEEKFTGKKLDVSHFRVFGCITYVHVPDEKRSKLDPKAEKCIFIGYSLEQKGYRCFNPSTRKLQVSKDVVFDKMVSWYSPLKIAEDGEARNGDVSSNVEQESQLISGPQESSISGSNNTPWKGRLRSSKIVDGTSQTSSKNSHVDDESSDSEKSVSGETKIPSVTTLGAWMAKKALKTPDNNNGVRRSTRVKYPVQRLTYDGFVAHHYAYMVRVLHEVEPTYFEQVVGNPKWDNAMDEEMAALDANATWELVALPKDKKAIGCKWVYKVKHNADGSVSRYKARLVVKGYAQTYGIDYEETYSPVAKMTTVRAIIVMAITKGWSLHQMDVNNVFLHGDLQEEMYMEQPPGYVDQTHPNLVCRLKKALYGLKQAPRAWSDKIAQYLVTSGFQTSKADFSLYVKKTDYGIVIIIIYVDDLISTRDSDVDIFDLNKLLKQKFEMKDLGKLRYFLGIEVIQSPKGIWLLQRQ
jgi:hypothetical protein